jgi:hypothetical protein
MICTLSARRRSSFRNRASRSRIVRVRSLNVTGQARRDMVASLILSPRTCNPLVTSVPAY